MLKKIFTPHPFKTFYIVFVYILTFSFWWAYLLYEKNETAFVEKIELNKIRHLQTGSSSAYEDTAEYRQVVSKYKRQRFMILTEGGVFIILLLFGLMRVRKVFFDEIKLAVQQRNFLLSVTHELKSPVSTVKISLQTLLKRKLEPEKTERLLSNSLVDLDRLETLVENILFAAKIERDEPGFSNEEINISEVIVSAVERFSVNKKSINVNADVKPDVYMKMDLIGFTSVINNLLENAIKYSEEGTVVIVSLKVENENVLLWVADQGAGIPEADKLKVFEKFYRVGSENTRKTKGTGLGLYIVKRFVEIYKGEITIEDNSPKGSIFKLTFPVEV